MGQEQSFYAKQFPLKKFKTLSKITAIIGEKTMDYL